MDLDYKIIFWVLAIGFYIFTQIKDAVKKGNKTDPIPMGPPLNDPRSQQKRREAEPVTTSTSDPYKRSAYKAQPQPKFAKRFQSTYSKSAELKKQNSPDIDNYNKEVISREAFYKETHKQEKPVNYEDMPETADSKKSIFGVDEHLEHYAIKPKTKHPLIIFLSNKNNLRNAFITGEVLKRRN